MLVSMHRGALVVALAGCGFHGAEAPDARTIDAAIDVPDAAGSTFCDPIDGLVACYEFEGNTSDATTNHLDAVATNVMYIDDRFGKAMQLALTSAATVGASNKFDLSQLTIEAWVNPTTLPAPTRVSVVLAVSGQYMLWIDEFGRLVCDLHGATRVTSTATVATAMWSHVACTYDADTARVYVNGVGTPRGRSGDLSGGSNAMSIGGSIPAGSRWIGLIDELRLLSVARSGPQICSDAGQTGCP